MADKEDPVVKALYQGIVTAHMVAMSAQFVARELMIDVARLQPDPQRYIRELYDRAISHVDRRMDAGEAVKESIWQTRDLLGALFRDAEKALWSTPQEDPPADETPKG